jgi:insertion element IS1 protein InsB
MVKKKVLQLTQFSESLLPAKAGDIIEYDEMWSFVQSKANRVWLWIALCRRTKQVIAFHLGNRTKEEFGKFYEKVPPAYAGCVSHSDGFEAYATISKYYHTKSKNKSGRTAQVEAFNTILRQRIARLVRKTCAFSKSLEMHQIVLRLFIQEYNENIKSVKS